MKNLQTAERRYHERINCSLSISVDDYENAYSGNIRNIGLGGAFVEMDIKAKPPIGNEVLVTIPYQKKPDYLIIRGRVIWSKPEGVGISFLKDAPSIQ
jgi:Tfp pilus assembly protein PilZ